MVLWMETLYGSKFCDFLCNIRARKCWQKFLQELPHTALAVFGLVTDAAQDGASDARVHLLGSEVPLDGLGIVGVLLGIARVRHVTCQDGIERDSEAIDIRLHTVVRYCLVEQFGRCETFGLGSLTYRRDAVIVHAVMLRVAEVDENAVLAVIDHNVEGRYVEVEVVHVVSMVECNTSLADGSQ